MSKTFDESNIQGLTDQEVLERLAQDGYNELPSAKKRSLLHIVFEVVREPMFLMLIACGLLYLFLGDVEEALMLLGFVFVVIGITLYPIRRFLRNVFSFGPLHAWELGFIAVAGMTSILVSESVKTTLFQKMFVGASRK